VPGCQKLQITIYPGLARSVSFMATVGVRRLISRKLRVLQYQQTNITAVLIAESLGFLFHMHIPLHGGAYSARQCIIVLYSVTARSAGVDSSNSGLVRSSTHGIHGRPDDFLLLRLFVYRRTRCDRQPSDTDVTSSNFR